MNSTRVSRYSTAISLALALSATYAVADNSTSTTDPTPTNSQPSQPLTGKQKATAIGAASGAVAGAVVGGPIGAVVGAGVGGFVGHEGTDANGHVSTSNPTDSKVRQAQIALNTQGYNAGTVDGRFGPNTESAVRRFQAKNGLTESGALDTSTLSALGVNS
jgi:phage tail tape-measure protein